MFDRRKRETTCTVLHLTQHFKIKKKMPSHSLQILILLPHVFLKFNMILSCFQIQLPNVLYLASQCIGFRTTFLFQIYRTNDIILIAENIKDLQPLITKRN